ncbi:MAG: VCBS repeat-containing protein, partial [Gemmatimonadaceae bacterium]
MAHKQKMRTPSQAVCVALTFATSASLGRFLPPSSIPKTVTNHHLMSCARTFRNRRIARLIPLLCFIGCSAGQTERPLFKLLSPDETGITFANTITTNDSLNVQTDVYIYNGAGVAVGDIDNDGLPDIFFTGNMVSSRLYLNKG